MPNNMLSRSLSFYLIFYSTIFFSKVITSLDFNLKNNDKLSECSRCKMLSGSFNYWLDKTSRGKYEGGDTAWEEAKLKSYSRSEIRLVEIQENLCSEVKKHQDQCYILAEEAEHVLEKWWFNEDPSSIELYTWLCIDTLQYCCPALHYGEACYPCPLSKDNKICSGHGQCNGEGTRNGNGTCICKRGYVGNNCDECAKNYYSNSDSCEPCHKSCDSCSGEGAASCLMCRKGWQMISGKCDDIDECLTSRCKQSEYCVNLEGSYICNPCDKSCSTCLGAGTVNCSSCDTGFILWSGTCLAESQKVDILKSTLSRLTLYCGLLIIALFIFRTSRLLATVVILIISMYVYYSERTTNINSIDVLKNIYIQ